MTSTWCASRSGSQSGLPLGYEQSDIRFSGHAIECRVTAEDPENLHAGARRVEAFHPPGGLGVRVNSALYAGYQVPPYYDSLIAKLARARPDAAAGDRPSAPGLG